MFTNIKFVSMIVAYFKQLDSILRLDIQRKQTLKIVVKVNWENFLYLCWHTIAAVQAHFLDNDKTCYIEASK